MGKLSGKIAIVTGAGSGIGRATALRFADEGAMVLATDIDDGAEATAAMRDDGAVVAVTSNAGSETDVAALVQRALDDFGGLHVFFANAGVSGGMAGIFEQSASDWERLLRVNLIGPFLAVKYAGKTMAEQQQGGSIICTASVAGLRSGAGGPAYSASKAGVINLVQVAAQQLSGSDVRVNAICPGLVETGMTEFIFETARERGVADKIGALNPLKRDGRPDEIAAAALFLASSESSYVNGHALVVDGGLSSSHPFTRQKFGRSAI